MKFSKGTLVKTSQGKIGEIIETEGYVIKDLNDITISDTYDDYDVCDNYRLSLNKDFTVCKIPCIVKLGKNGHPIYTKNLKYLPVIYFKFRDFYGNDVVMRQYQNTALILKKFLEKSNIKYYMSDTESFDFDNNLNDVEG